MSVDFNKILTSAPANVASYAREIVKREGGWVDHPSDPGGATNRGVSLRYAIGKGLAFDLDNDGDVDKEDIRIVTPEIAAGAFVQDFFYTPKINLLPQSFQASVFDMAVNSGGPNAVKLLQRTLNKLAIKARKAERLIDDGQLGPMTAKFAVDLINNHGLNTVVFTKAYAEERILYYRDLVAHNSKYAVFLNGWIARANSMITSK